MAWRKDNYPGIRELNDVKWRENAYGLAPGKTISDGLNCHNANNLMDACLQIGRHSSMYLIDMHGDFVFHRRTTEAEEQEVLRKNPNEILDVKVQQSLAARSRDANVVKSEVACKVKGGKKKKEVEVEIAEELKMQYIEIDLTDLDTVVKTIVENEKLNVLPTTYVIRRSDSKDQFHLENKNISESHVLTNLLLHYIKETNFIPKANTRTSSKDNMSCIESLILHNGNIIKLYKDLETRQKCAEKLDITFKDQSMSSISMEHFSRTYPHLRKSTLSHKMVSILDFEGKPSIFYGKLQDVVFDPETMDAYDIPKCYTTSMYNMSLEYAIFTIFDHVEEYDADKSNDGKKAGLYLVKTENVIPCNGDGWYSNVIVQKLINEGIPHQVTDMIIASYSLPATYFKKFIDETKDLLGDEHAKFPINSVIGNLGRRENDESEGWKTSIVHRFQKSIHGFDLYQVSASQFYETLESHRPLRKQIIDNANCMLYDMAKDLVAGTEKVIAVKTDCIIVRKDDVIENPLSFPAIPFQPKLKYRREERLPVIQSHIPKHRILKFKVRKLVKDRTIERDTLDRYLHDPINIYRSEEYSSKIWERKVDLRIKKGEDGAQMLLNLLNGQGCRIQADAGFGKSHLLQELTKRWEDQNINVKTISYLILAFTNMAAENVNGKTIHKGLTIDMTQVARMMKKLPDVILVDEISQIPAYLWNILYAYKMKGCKFFIFGDAVQLPPVELPKQMLAEDYLETEMVSFIADGNLITLTENHRYINDPSNKMHEIVEAVKKGTFDTSAMTLHNVDNVIKAGTINIGKTNRMRKYINKLHMDKLRETTHKASLTLPYCYGDKETQECFLVKGSPLVARCSGAGIVKGTEWTVYSWDKDNVTCRRNSNDALSTVSREIFQKKFLVAYCITIHKAQ
ncbi:hypothetical protein HDU88_008754, partial [Geranomyces variabilis]